MSEALSSVQRRALAELVRVFPVVDEIGTRFQNAGHELHLVGGSVRDALLGRLGDDLDFATDARPEQTAELLRGWADAIWETGREFGTIGAARPGLRLESTPSRAHEYDRASPKPAGQAGTSLVHDLTPPAVPPNASGAPSTRTCTSTRSPWCATR